MRFARYVALGDSTTEGLDDPDGAGGFRGWANRLAEQLARAYGSIEYANLAVRAKTAGQIREEQLGPALALAPDLATVVAGMNDLIGFSFDASVVAGEVAAMQRALVAAGCHVVTVTIPDLSHRLAVGPFSRLLANRTRALNAALREVTRDNRAQLVDLGAYELARDPRLWSRDRLHLNAEGHARNAAALAYALEVPGSDESWAAPLPAASPPRLTARLAEDLAWGRDYFAPWAMRRLRGTTLGDGRSAKLPTYVTVSE